MLPLSYIRREYFYRNGFTKTLQTGGAITTVTCQKLSKCLERSSLTTADLYLLKGKNWKVLFG